MGKKLKYVPVLRVRQEEIKVLGHFEFEENIYPCLEIIKEVDRKLPEKSKVKKSFEGVYLPLIKDIRAQWVFVDLPVHLKPVPGMQKDTLDFLTRVVTKMPEKINYVKKFAPLADKVIPVISTYIEVTGERNTLITQENELRKIFSILAFRTFPKTFLRDIPQITKVIKETDYVMMDWGEIELDLEDGDQQDILEALRKLPCHVIVHRNPFPLNLTNSGLVHGSLITDIDNSLLNKFKDFEGNSFSDYSGIKKDNISGAPITSPGFIYYDAAQNSFFGFRYKFGGHKKGQKKPHLAEYESTIVPSVIASDATRRMQQHSLDFLSQRNVGWNIIQNIHLGILKGGESGKSAAKFKRIAVEHYLHCLRSKIANGDFH